MDIVADEVYEEDVEDENEHAGNVEFAEEEVNDREEKAGDVEAASEELVVVFAGVSVEEVGVVDNVEGEVAGEEIMDFGFWMASEEFLEFGVEFAEKGAKMIGPGGFLRRFCGGFPSGFGLVH